MSTCLEPSLFFGMPKPRLHSSFALIPRHGEAWAPFPHITHRLGVTEGITISAWSRDNSPLTSVPDESAGDPEEHASTVGTAVPSPTRSSQTYIHYIPTSYDPDTHDNSRFPAPCSREDRYKWMAIPHQYIHLLGWLSTSMPSLEHTGTARTTQCVLC